MNRVASETFIPTMAERIVTRFQPLRIVLFGSHARDTASKWSDVDLLVILPTFFVSLRRPSCAFVDSSFLFSVVVSAKQFCLAAKP